MRWLTRLLRRTPAPQLPTVAADAPPVDVDAAVDLPPVAPPTIGLPEFDVVTLVFRDSVHWAARDRQTGEEHMTSMWRPHEVASAEHILETLRPWLAERAGGRPALVRAFSAELRRAASAHLFDDAEIVLVDLLSCRPSTAWADAARTELGRRRAEEQEAAARAAKTSKPSPPRKKRRPQTIYAASDGSKHRRGSRFASAWVTSTGEFQVTNGRGSISEAELRAAISFLRWFHANRKSAKDRAVLFVDRMETHEILTGTTHIAVHGHDHAFEAVELVRTGQVDVIWVRGHADNLLNDLADRIALQKYRSLGSDIASEVVDALCARIVEDARGTLADTEWSKVAEAARVAHRRHLERFAAHV